MVCFYVISSGPVTQVSVKAGLILESLFNLVPYPNLPTKSQSLNLSTFGWFKYVTREKTNFITGPKVANLKRSKVEKLRDSEFVGKFEV